MATCGPSPATCCWSRAAGTRRSSCGRRPRGRCAGTRRAPPSCGRGAGPLDGRPRRQRHGRPAAGVAEGARARGGREASGFPAGPNGHVPPVAAGADRPPLALFAVEPEEGAGWDEHYLDLQRDATVADLQQAVGAGLRSPEHVKRFTTIGTANDQGRTSGVLTLGVLAGLIGAEMGSVHPTTHRPPAVPVPFSLLAGRDRGVLSDPVRTTAIHSWHEAHGAIFEDVGQWKRPWYYRAGTRTWTPQCCASAARRARASA